jgi:hypothetical protein
MDEQFALGLEMDVPYETAPGLSADALHPATASPAGGIVTSHLGL